jgi:ribosomal protein S18 acetylase RimI-like enzyme
VTGIRPWRATDLEEIRRVAWLSWEAAYGNFIPEADRRDFHSAYYALDKLKNLYSSHVVEGCVAVVNDQVVGYSKTHWNEEKQEFFVTSLYVLPEYQKLRLGKGMLDFGLEKAELLGLDKVWLGVMVDNRPAIKWYIKQGFIFVDLKPFTIGNTTIDDLIGYKLIGSE